MKILFLCNLVTSKVAAFEGLILAIGERLHTRGDAMRVMLAAPPGGELRAQLAAHHVEWGVIPGWTGDDGAVHAWRFVRPALAAIREYGPDLVAVHFGNEAPSTVAAWASSLARRPRPVWVWHQRQQVSEPTALTRHVSLLRLAVLAMDHFVVSYEGGRRSLEQRGIPANRITSIYNAVGSHVPMRPSGWLRAELGLGADTPLVVNVGWLVPRKRIELSIEAFASCCGADVHVRLPPELPHLLIVGEGPERATLGEWAQRLGVADRVHFLGQRPDVRDILSECDVLLHSSIAETCTNVVIESMAAGIPAVIMEAGAAHEQIENGTSGYVVGPRDVQGLATGLGRLLDDAEVRRRMGARARERWAARFCVDITAEQHVRLYRDLVKRPLNPEP